MCEYSTGVTIDIIEEDISKNARFLLGGTTSIVPSNNKTLVFLALNPSKANKTKSDKTVNNMIEFAKDNGYGKWIVINLYPLYEPASKKLPNSPDRTLLLQNIKHIESLLIKNTNLDILACWGDPISKHHYLRLSLYSIYLLLYKQKWFYFTYNSNNKTASGEPFHFGRKTYKKTDFGLNQWNNNDLKQYIFKY